MPTVRKVLWIVPVALAVGLSAAPIVGGPQPAQTSEASKPRTGTDVEVKYIDDSVMKLKLLDEKLELVTKHGTLRIAVSEIRRIEFATRLPAATTDKAAAAIAKLNHSDFKVRESATEELKELRDRAYPSLVKALKHEDPEVSRRAEEVVKFVRNKVPAANLEHREFDVIHTDDSKIAGKLTTESLRVGTFQFGEQHLKLTDVRLVRTGPEPTEQLVNAQPAPPSLFNYANQFGKEFVFRITGAQGQGQGGAIWGSGTYTLDSNPQMAVVHAGFAKPGETVVVRVRIIAPPAQFAGTTQNGITSAPFGPFPSGAFEFLPK
ncbi:hypothetical protein J8F10_28390 [Gemmata sp. G18]|uniref:ENT domain-containing protein n=1 Tax=Gemmata palustris TaxID=2822762 RepID=A0ABS5BZM7_9BACT|nr:LCCL domain-containing protein [Gemmata palustris]MBP3959182.1 hypothetical protein [Gemmata palustris]